VAKTVGKRVLIKRFQSRAAAVGELNGDNPSICENAYETALWMLYAILDKTMREAELIDGDDTEEDITIKEDDNATLQKFINSIQTRLEALHRKMKAASSNNVSNI
jgi:serine/threonine-protein kinase ULK2